MLVFLLTKAATQNGTTEQRTPRILILHLSCKCSLKDYVKIFDISGKIVPFATVFKSVDMKLTKLVFKRETSTVLRRSKMKHV